MKQQVNSIPRLKTSADYEFMLRVLLKFDHKVKYLPEVFVKMRTGGVSNASLSNRLKANREDKKHGPSIT